MTNRVRPSAVRFVLTVVPIADAVAPIVRVRRALKALLRSYGLRCVSVEERRDAAAGGKV